MTNETKQQIADAFATASIEDKLDIMDRAFDAVESDTTGENVKEFTDAMIELGVDMSGWCRKKHPA